MSGTIVRTSASLVKFPMGIFLKGEADRCHSAPDNHSPASTRPTPMSWLCVGTMRMGRGPCRAGMVAPVISRDSKRGQHRGGATVWDLWPPSESQMDPSLCTLESASSCWDSGCMDPLPDTRSITAWRTTQDKQNKQGNRIFGFKPAVNFYVGYKSQYYYIRFMKTTTSELHASVHQKAYKLKY